jgi:hypothetical protein
MADAEFDLIASEVRSRGVSVDFDQVLDFLTLNWLSDIDQGPRAVVFASSRWRQTKGQANVPPARPVLASATFFQPSTSRRTLSIVDDLIPAHE